MLRNRLKTGDTAKRSLHKALRTRALSETLKERHREYTRDSVTVRYINQQLGLQLRLRFLVIYVALSKEMILETQKSLKVIGNMTRCEKSSDFLLVLFRCSYDYLLSLLT